MKTHTTYLTFNTKKRQEIIDMISGARGIMGEMTPQSVDIARAHKERLATALSNSATA